MLPLKMENSRWRVGAKIVAIIDIVLVSISFFLYVFGIACWIIMLQRGQNAGERKQESSVLMTWFGFDFLPLFMIPTLASAMALFSSSKVDRQPKTAFRLVKIWTSWAILSLAIFVMSALFTQQFVYLAITLVFRVSRLFIVQTFIQELDRTASAKNPQDVVGSA